MNILGCFAFLSSFYFCSGYSSDGIYRPCRRSDRRCIGRVFSQELGCPLRAQIRDTRDITYLPLYYPGSNLSMIYTKATMYGLTDFRVQEFYINRRTKTLVLEIVFRSIDVEAPVTTGYFYRKGRAPVVTRANTYTIYRNYSLTLTVFNVDGRTNRGPDDYQVYTYLSQGSDPEFGYEEKFIPRDPEALREWNSFWNNFDVSFREETITQGPLLMSFVVPCELPAISPLAGLNPN